MILLASLVLAQPLLAFAAVPSPLVEIHADIDGDGLQDTLQVEQRREGVFLVITTAAGIRREKGLGIESLNFLVDGSPSRLCVRDVNGDGTADILVAGAVGDRAELFILDWDGGSLRSVSGEELVSDQGWEADAIRVESSGHISLATVRPGLHGSRATHDQWQWSAEAGEYLWIDGFGDPPDRAIADAR